MGRGKGGREEAPLETSPFETFELRIVNPKLVIPGAASQLESLKDARSEPLKSRWGSRLVPVLAEQNNYTQHRSSDV